MTKSMNGQQPYKISFKTEHEVLEFLQTTTLNKAKFDKYIFNKSIITRDKTIVKKKK